MLFMVGLVRMEIKGSLVCESLVSVVVVLVICISEKRFFCMWVLLDVVMQMKGDFCLMVV